MLGISPLSTLPLSSLPAVSVGVTLRIAGVTRNRCAAPEPGATVHLFRVSDNVLVATTTSDGAGAYEFVNPSGEPFYAASFSSDGSLAGVTGRNLTPA